MSAGQMVIDMSSLGPNDSIAVDEKLKVLEIRSSAIGLSLTDGSGFWVVNRIGHAAQTT
ncbi:MAG TPA: hypothetical protein H9994_00530 [Candidatus Salinicoccus merdavium]|nr:hypothetical protein [Candidatus Salinicoccus merdavium]